MKIIVLSDTHCEEDLPQQVWEAIDKADAIIHVGDFCDIELFHLLQKKKPIKAVYGNMDGLELRGELPRQAIFDCEGFKIGLVHGEGAPHEVLKKVQERFKKHKVDAVIFGHSHIPSHKEIDGVLYFNPGSPTDCIRSPYRSYGVLKVEKDKIEAKIVKVK